MLMRDHNYWLRIAEEDWTAIRNLRAAEDSPRRIVVFLAQSAAEKYLKAFLAFHDSEPKRTHDMDALLSECETFDPSLNLLAADCGQLSIFSVDARYPEFEGIYDEQSARLAVAAAERICDAIHKSIS